MRFEGVTRKFLLTSDDVLCDSTQTVIATFPRFAERQRIVGTMIMTADERSSKAPTWQGRKPVKERFGSRLHELRTDRGYTQMELAMRASLDRSFLSDMERGVKEPTLTTLDTLAKAFSMTLSEFLESI